MGSSMLRWICERGVSDYNSLRCISTRVFKSTNSWYGSKGARISTVSVSDESVLCPSSTLPSRVSPWLMLPPAFEGGDIVYNFYSLAQDKVVSINKKGGGGEELELPDDDAKLVGSSHGWLALFSQRNNDLFLSNPLSRRHIKLPPIDTLPNPEINLKHGRGSVSKVIISCSPDEEECRAMMTFGPGDRLAFCSPGRSSGWTPIGDLFHKDEEPDMKYGRVYEDFVYSNKHKLFSCIAQFNMGDWDMEDWDLRNPRSPRINWMEDVEKEFKYVFGNCPCPSDEYLDLIGSCWQLKYLVFAEQSDQLFLVKRYIMQRMGSDGCEIKRITPNPNPDTGCYDDQYPYKTIGFYVVEVDREERKLKMQGSLDGLAMFIGRNHSFAISAAEFPALKPNSIYFTDDKEFTPSDHDSSTTYGGHDLGIFDYENRTFAPCHYPCDVQSVKRIVPAPMWFTPSQY